jgi:hypothetical protein
MSTVDAEVDGQPTATANGDDLNGSDDEDGVTLPTVLFTAGSAQIYVTSTGTAVLNAWVDWSGIGGWEASEQVLDDQPLVSGVNPLSFPVPIDAVPGTTFARFRICSGAGLCDTVTGLAPDGEVEDHQVTIEQGLDFGDAPDPTYPTLMASSGPRHVATGGLSLGSLIDTEIDGLPDTNALGDDNDIVDDEDGVVFTGFLDPGGTVDMDIDVTASSAAQVSAWIDFNGNGSWTDAGEQVLNAQAVTNGLNPFTIPVPSGNHVVTSFARVRLCSATATCNSLTGLASDGEVEDYEVLGDVIFMDGFEDGTTNSWSGVMP